MEPVDALRDGMAKGRRRVLWRLCLGAVAALGVLPAAATAQTRGPAAAEALFKEGRAASERRDYDVACAKFRESERMDPAPGTLLNLAECEENRNNLATAWALFEELAQRLPPHHERAGIV